ncbi:unnamed protein product [Heligmosomoides polygyrus]|uniref:Secreted protein n=1 Tax=Heligmosomoides polygyrus TaxID=6339 RepID=A0A183GGI9_HELPZ|nr:unnamed protein product [Heligmosomoides polygyrus]
MTSFLIFLACIIRSSTDASDASVRKVSQALSSKLVRLSSAKNSGQPARLPEGTGRDLRRSRIALHVLPVYRVQAFVRADTVTIRTGANTSTHTVHEHAAPTHKESFHPTQLEQGVHPLHPTCVSGQYTVAFGSRFRSPIHHPGRATWPCDKRPEIPLNKRTRRLSIKGDPWGLWMIRINSDDAFNFLAPF